MQNVVKLGKPREGKSAMESSGDRLLAVLGLFTIERPRWAVEAAAEQLGVSPATCYRYFKRLTNVGMISPVSGAEYTLGPAIIQMDRQIQISDPMLRAARGVMHELIQHALEGSTAMLCRLFHDRVMCVHQVFGRGPQEPVAYERGRPMPLFRGATSKAILAHLPPRKLKSLYENHADEIGQSWDEFRAKLAEIRRNGYAVSRREMDPARIGLGAPVFDKDRAVLGSLSFALSYDRTDEAQIERLAPLIMAGAREVERLMDEQPLSQGVGPARLRVAREA